MTRRIVLALAAVALAIAAAPYARPAIERAWFVYTLWTDPPPEHLPSPIARVSPRAIANSWGTPRSGGRGHQGVDIFAPKDTPVLSTTRGIVASVGTNTLGGLVVWVIGPGLEWHYYAHLDRYGAFRVGDVAWGLQFHVEATEAMVREWAESDGVGPEVADAVRFADDVLRSAGDEVARRFARIVIG